ncbi:hypothetical protein Oweho_0266 [Owenweeksia hongkongensis DSM 17368]|uniref:Outer membrane protein beta-barrel domain-containing protein n=1 Tax=Owenweeksia hongkongensis (strain DSM 17368 / CIP 108786 / JCM 12287 / NRRL B-23963 / UST20020801) TaxID=926562 RepID=G8R7W5_OWEHD|nr:hypothetical protein [Owenweeksia hongkongensis]AEV31288.1 hypothetical protein Oweho_0266 [Owenweeksia hongkongensis DSM 17368]
MRISILAIFLISLSLNVFAQSKEIQTLQNCDSLSWGAYGGPRTSIINPVGKTAFMAGGQGAIVLNSQFALGGFGQGMTGSSEFDGVPNGYDNPLELSMGYGGIFLEYMPFRHKILHPSFSLPIGLGGASVQEVNSDSKISKTTLVAFTPRVGLDFNISKSAVVSLFAGYQFIKTNDDFMIADHDLSGWELGISVKLGKF